jgi:hypothetical protein
MAVALGAVPAASHAESCCSLTAADSGDVFRVRVGAMIEVHLAGSRLLPWTLPRGVGAAVARVDAARHGGYVTATFMARHAGSAVVRATQTPACRAARPPCAAPTRLFVVHLVVRDLPTAAARAAIVDASRDEIAILDLLRRPRPPWYPLGQRIAYARLHLREALAALPSSAGPTRLLVAAAAENARAAPAAVAHDRTRVRAAVRQALADEQGALRRLTGR